MWFRLYTDILTSRKVLTLEPELFKAWVLCLALTKEGGGLLPPIEDVAFGLRTSTAEAQRLTEALVKCGLLDSDGVNLSPHNWHIRQFESDSSTERVKRFRNVSETLVETAPEQIQSRDRTRDRTEQSRGGLGEPDPSPASRAKPRSARAPVLPDDEWLDNLQKNPAYSMFDVRMLYLKMLEWCRVNGKTPSRRRFINWLNKEDKPMTAKAAPQKKPDPGARTAYTLEEAARLEETFDWDDWVTQCIANGWRGQLEADRKIIAKRGGPKEPWEHRVYEFLNAATEAA